MPEQKGFGLILSRKVGESIVINGNIVVTVRDIDRNKIRLGIEAPRSIPIHRCETKREGDQWTARPLH
jgi:carbon storage regulator CsrA